MGKSAKNFRHLVHFFVHISSYSLTSNGVRHSSLVMRSAGNVYPLCKPWVIERPDLSTRSFDDFARNSFEYISLASTPCRRRFEISRIRRDPLIRVKYSNLTFRLISIDRDSFPEGSQEGRGEDQLSGSPSVHRRRSSLYEAGRTVTDIRNGTGRIARGRWMTQAGWLFSWLSPPGGPRLFFSKRDVAADTARLPPIYLALPASRSWSKIIQVYK